MNKEMEEYMLSTLIYTAETPVDKRILHLINVLIDNNNRIWEKIQKIEEIIKEQHE